MPPERRDALCDSFSRASSVSQRRQITPGLCGNQVSDAIDATSHVPRHRRDVVHAIDATSSP
jgi:hypothetical protein